MHICRVLLRPNSLCLVWGHSVVFAKFPILRFSKRYVSNNLHRIPSKLYGNIAYRHGGMQAVTLLGNRPSLQNLWHFEIFTLESMGKPKIWNISKTDDCRAKRIIDRKAKGKLWYFEIFLTHDHMQVEISKCYFSHNFHWSPSKLHDNIGYHEKSKCHLEYCNEKLSSST